MPLLGIVDATILCMILWLAADTTGQRTGVVAIYGTGVAVVTFL